MLQHHLFMFETLKAVVISSISFLFDATCSASTFLCHCMLARLGLFPFHITTLTKAASHADQHSDEVCLLFISGQDAGWKLTGRPIDDPRVI